VTQANPELLAGVQWRKSSYSTGGNQCVEVARLAGSIAVRDSKDPDAGHLAFSAASWRRFLGDAKRGSYDL
jgi:hypothetical protein